LIPQRTKIVKNKPGLIRPAQGIFTYTPLVRWNQQEAADKLEELYKGALEMADSTIHWYRSYRSRKGKWAKGIRIVAILFLIGSTLMPYFASLGEGNKANATILYIGYLFAGLGGGLLLLDRYYGYSNSWVRFVLTGMDLEGIRNAFVEHWQIVYIQNQPLTKSSFCTLVNEVTTFRELFTGAVKAETQAWAREFQQSFNDLISALKTQGDQLKDAYQQSRQSAKKNDQATDTDVDAEDIPEEIFQEAIEEKYEEWKTLYKVVAIAYGRKIKDGNIEATNCLIFMPPAKLEKDQAEFNPIPLTIPYKSASGIIYDLPTDVRAAGGAFRAATVPALLCDSNLPKRPGCSISRINDDNKDSTGTLGLKVYKGTKEHILGCYHVLCARELEGDNTTFTLQNAVGSSLVVSPSRQDAEKGLPLGSVIDGELNDFLDGALIVVDEKVTIQDKICSIDRRPAGILTVLKEHADHHLAVVAVGRTSGIIPGSIEAHDASCDIEYSINGRWQVKTLQHVILTNQRTAGGDSGSAVLDHDNNVIGILVACTNSQSCIVPIGRLLTRFNITLKPTT
jgi:hypothetical protein